MTLNDLLASGALDLDPSSPSVLVYKDSICANASLIDATSLRVACSLSRPSRVASSCSLAPSFSFADKLACSLRSFLRNAEIFVRSSGDLEFSDEIG